MSNTSNQGNNQGTTRSDPAGNVFQVPARGPAPNGTPATHSDGSSGAVVGGYFIRDKQGS
jgi:hypothetical protein